MISVAKDASHRGPIELEDDVIEHSVVITSLLSILNNTKEPDIDDYKLTIHVIELALKWEMTAVLKAIRYRVRDQAMSVGSSTRRLLYCSVAARDYDTIALLIEKRGEKT